VNLFREVCMRVRTDSKCGAIWCSPGCVPANPGRGAIPAPTPPAPELPMATVPEQPVFKKVGSFSR
jgi:hypothetical protein